MSEGMKKWEWQDEQEGEWEYWMFDALLFARYDCSERHMMKVSSACDWSFER